MGQELGAAVVARGYEAMLIPSATGLGNNIIIFPANLKSGSHIQLIDSQSYPLYVDRR